MGGQDVMLDETLLALLAALVLTGVAAVWDLRTGLIPNRLVLAGALVAWGMTCLLGYSHGLTSMVHGLVAMVAGALLVSLVPVVLYRLGGLGGGDVKLLAVLGATLGPYLGLEAELYAFVAALLYAPARLLWQGKLIPSLRTAGQLLLRSLLPRSKRGEPVPLEAMTSFRFGPAIFLGTAAVAALRFTSAV